MDHKSIVESGNNMIYINNQYAENSHSTFFGISPLCLF